MYLLWKIPCVHSCTYQGNTAIQNARMFFIAMYKYNDSMAIITETMEKKKWTQKQLAIAVDVDRADISRYENGTKGAMNFKKLKIFAEALDVTIDDLLDKENLKRGASIQKKYDQLNPVHMIAKNRAGTMSMNRMVACDNGNVFLVSLYSGEYYA